MKSLSILSALAALSLAVAAPALADQEPTVDAATPPSASAPSTPGAAPATDTVGQTTSADDQKVVCKTEPPPTGSRMGGRKVCRTIAEWRRQQAIAKETTDEIQMRKVPEPAF